MFRARPEPADFLPRTRASSLAFPWLLSTSVHSILFVLLALTIPAVRVGSPFGGDGTALEVSIVSGSGAPDGDPASDWDGPPGDGYFEDDEPALYALESESPSAAGNGGAPTLKSILAEEPAVAMNGVLPGAGAGGGFGGLESGVVSATALMGESAPAGRMRGGRARTGVFGLMSEGHKFVYVFDRSGSMDGHGGAPLLAAKAELLGSLKDLGQTHQFQIIFYNEQPRIFTPTGDSGRLVFGTEQNKNLARRFVGSITASGATRHVEALQMALRLAPDVIFFLTDADEPRMTPRELADIAQMNRGTTINTVEFGTNPQADADNFIVRLARQNGGQHVYIDVTRLNANRR